MRLGAVALGVAIGICPLLCVAQTAADAAKRPIVPPSPKRLPDGKPNWTGFWVPVNGMLEHNIGLGGTDPSKGPPLGFHPPKYPELKSPYKEKLAKFTADANEKGRVEDNTSLCFPPGMPRMMGMIYGMELLQTPGQVTMTSEWQAASRRIWLNRSQHPPADELDPTYTGDSIGHWEGDRLIVDTVGVREDVPLNFGGLPHSPDLHIREVFSSKVPGILDDEITIDDPTAFVASWTETQHYRYRPDLTIREYECLENNRNVGDKGQATFEK